MSTGLHGLQHREALRIAKPLIGGKGGPLSQKSQDKNGLNWLQTSPALARWVGIGTFKVPYANTRLKFENKRAKLDRLLAPQRITPRAMLPPSAPRTYACASSWSYSRALRPRKKADALELPHVRLTCSDVLPCPQIRTPPSIVNHSPKRTLTTEIKWGGFRVTRY